MGESDSNTLINALIGAVTTIIFSFTMFSPVLGGAVAGYLERRDGARVGAISGAMATIPLFLLAALIVGVMAVPAHLPGAFSLFIVVMMFVIAPIYIIGLSALGGYLGVYVRGELA